MVTGKLTGIIDFTDAYVGDPHYDLVALHFGVFRTAKHLLARFLDGYGWPDPGKDWPRAMLALTLLHDFNMFAAPDQHGHDLAAYATLDELASALWDLDTPDAVRG